MKMTGRDVVEMGREGFLAIAPPYTGDILWEHLDILQKGKLQAYINNPFQFSHKQPSIQICLNQNPFTF